MADETAQKPKRTRTRVPMVTTHPDDIGFEVAADDEIGRRGAPVQVIDDAQQQKTVKAVQASYDQNKWLTATGKPGSSKELVKRLRAAAATLSYGMSIGTVTDTESGVRVPFKAGKRRTYRRGGSQATE